MEGHRECSVGFVLAAIFSSICLVSGRTPVTCDIVIFPCPCKTLTNVGADFPLLDLNCSNMELTHIPDMRPLRKAKIYRLDLSKNRIRFVNDSAFAGLDFQPERQYAVLRLSNNPVEFISPNAFRGITATKFILELKEMRLETFPFHALKHIPSVTHLKLDSNHLTNLPFNAFEGLLSLELLSLAHNPIKVLTPGILKDQTDSLKVLGLQNTGMIDLPLDVLDKLKYLNKLYLQGNHITYLPNKLLERLPRTVKELDLDLSHNKLTQIQYDVFARLNPRRNPIKVNLILDFNQIQSLSFIEQPCDTMFRVGSQIIANDNPISCTCELYSVILTKYFLIDIHCENPSDYKGIFVYATPMSGLTEVSLEYERKVKHKCTGANLQKYDMKCIKSRKPITTTSNGSSGSRSFSVTIRFFCFLTYLMFHLR